MKTYHIRVDCSYSEIITVEAENKEDAKEQAINEFQCSNAEVGQFVEFVDEL